ncbi:putative Endonuclease/exonuclease/phosphatase superfamily [Helianthus annuus]|nr:putative Endonuclease/exonuclease/phosphatase superfamily [Helianthus annuus]
MNLLSINACGIGGVGKADWIKGLKQEHGIDFLLIQETKKEDISKGSISNFWGNKEFDMEFVSSVGLSGGLLSMWDPSLFEASSFVKKINFLIVSGKIKGSGLILNVVNVYAPQSVSAKKDVWSELSLFLEDLPGMWVVGGDFNAVRDPSERRNSRFNNACATNFNSFIFNSGLREFDLKGSRFTCVRGNGRKLSKIDRFLVCSEFFDRWPNTTFRALPVRFSDHGPILLITQMKNFGAKPFRVFNSWLKKEGYKEAVEKSLEGLNISGPPDSVLIQKFAAIRKGIKVWRDEMKKKEGEISNRSMEEMEDLEKCMEVRNLTEEEEWSFLENKKMLLEFERNKAADLKQRARLKWAIDGDENSSFFHASVNARKAVNGIPGLILGSEWIDKPSLIKLEVMKFFRSRFTEEVSNRPTLDGQGMEAIIRVRKN